MAFRQKMMSLFYIYLVLSVDPIQASRIKTTRSTVEKAQNTQELIQEIQKALNENHMEELFIQNASSLYIGETWATCADRKADFERRSMKVKARYEEAQADGTLTAFESGWVVLKARSLALTVSTAAKQGCEWVQNSSFVDMSAIGQLMNETGKSVPCRDEAMAAMQKKDGGEPTMEDVTNSMSMLFSSDCKPHRVESSTNTEDVGKLLEAEETEEQEVQRLADQFQAKAEQQTGEAAIASLMERVAASTKSDIFITLPALLHIIVGMVIAALVCFVALALWAIVLGLIYCVLRALLSMVLELLGSESHELQDTFGACADRWISWLQDRSDEDKQQAVQLGAGLCVVTTLIGTPIAGIGGRGTLWFNTNWGHGAYWNYHHYGYYWR